MLIKAASSDTTARSLRLSPGRDARSAKCRTAAAAATAARSCPARVVRSGQRDDQEQLRRQHHRADDSVPALIIPLVLRRNDRLTEPMARAGTSMRAHRSLPMATPMPAPHNAEPTVNTGTALQPKSVQLEGPLWHSFVTAASTPSASPLAAPHSACYCAGRSTLAPSDRLRRRTCRWSIRSTSTTTARAVDHRRLRLSRQRAAGDLSRAGTSSPTSCRVASGRSRSTIDAERGSARVGI